MSETHVVASAALAWAPVFQPEPTVGWYEYFTAHRETPMPAQLYGWTCSACAIDWTARTTNLDPYSTREKVVGVMGYPNCINETHGLMSLDCAQKYMEQWEVGATNFFPGTFEEAYDVCSRTAGIFNSYTWQHFVAIRGVRNGNIWVANSAPGYRNIWDEITRSQFNAWAGTWKGVYLG